MRRSQTEGSMTEYCEHLSHLTEHDFPPPSTPNACEDCLKEGTRWVALRECKICGHVGCCDSSPGRHATRHFHETGHPVMRSVMPGDRWTWCYVHEVAGELAGAPVAAGKKR
jgi:CPA1 family monovalent cation:H+ antiporter